MKRIPFSIRRCWALALNYPYLLKQSLNHRIRYKKQLRLGLDRIITTIICLIISILLIGYGVIGLPSLVKAQIFSHRSETVFGNIAAAPVRLDGRILFEVTSPIAFVEQSDNPIYSVQQRVERIEKTLSNLLRNADRNTLKIEVSSLKNQTIIIASDAKNIRQITVVTITDLDAQLNAAPIPELAEQGREVIEQALLKAWQEREPKWLLRQSVIAVISLDLLFIFSKLLNTLLQSLREKSRHNQAEQESLRFFKHWILPMILLSIWLPSISLILGLFPYTREWGILFFKSAINLSVAVIVFLG
ncbi:MAG: hypothetical protein AB4058_12175, partial [Microcystaceae cyanobacterium]